MIDLTTSGSVLLGDRHVLRMGYGAMQLAGPGVFGPPKSPEAAASVLRQVIAAGVNHIDTSDFYGPHIINQMIRDTLQPYPQDLVIVTKVGAKRGPDASWNPAYSSEELIRAVHENLHNLGVEVLDVVNLRVWGDGHRPAEGSIKESLTTLVMLQRDGLIRHLGISNVTAAQVQEAQDITDIVCVQNYYNIAHRHDDSLIDDLNRQGIAYVPYFPLGGFTPLQSETLSHIAQYLGASPVQLALAWLLKRSPNILLIPGTSSVAHLHENLAATTLELTEEVFGELAEIGE
jgi:aryl-alcohol dehydrogenase-like predicted oxidoreductase